MELGRSIRLLAPLAVFTAVAAASPLAPPGGAAVQTPAGACPAGNASATGAGAAWFRLDPVLDAGGSLASVRLWAGGAAGVPFRVDLPAESFASGPADGQVLVGDDDGSRTRLRLLDVARGCWRAIAVEDAVVRSAVMREDAAVMYEHRVNRASRADLGVWRRETATGYAVRVLESVAPDAAYGRTYSTDLSLAPDGRVVATSCGAKACRTRVLDAATGHVDAVSATGPVIGLVGDHLVAMSACVSLPCDVEAVDLGSGARSRVADGVVTAAMGGSALVWADVDGCLWQADLAAGPGPAVRVRAAPGLSPVGRSSLAASGAAPTGAASSGAASSGATSAAGSVLLAPGGRIGDVGALRLLDPQSAHLARLVEVNP